MVGLQKEKIGDIMILSARLSTQRKKPYSHLRKYGFNLHWQQQNYIT